MQHLLKSICIVEDDDYKMADLIDWVTNFHPEAEITKATSFRSGSAALKNNKFNLILLDMQLQLYDQRPVGISAPDKLATFGGERLLRQLERSNTPSNVIVITQYTTFSEKVEEVTFESLNKRLQKSCPNVFKGGIHYAAGSIDWHKDLNALIQQL